MSNQLIIKTKMRFTVFFYFLTILLCPLIGSATENHDFNKKFDSATMDWTQWVITADGIVSSAEVSANKPISDDQLISMGHERAKSNLLSALKLIPMNASGSLSDIYKNQETIAAKVDEIVQFLKISGTRSLPNDEMVVTVQISLTGAFFQLVLPNEIRQVQSIKPMNDTAAADDSASSGYSGLIIDARGIGARPALVPVLVDETGQEVYGPAFISREYAVQNGVCMYVPAEGAVRQIPRIAPNPLLIRGLRSIGDNKCNIVISNADAYKLRDASTNLHFLKQCRVVIILD